MSIFREVVISFLAVFILASFLAYPCHMEKTSSDRIGITILYDNYVYTEGTRADWGFSCLIEGMERTILFMIKNGGEEKN